MFPIELVREYPQTILHTIDTLRNRKYWGINQRYLTCLASTNKSQKPESITILSLEHSRAELISFRIVEVNENEGNGEFPSFGLMVTQTNILWDSPEMLSQQRSAFAHAASDLMVEVLELPAPKYVFWAESEWPVDGIPIQHRRGDHEIETFFSTSDIPAGMIISEYFRTSPRPNAIPTTKLRVVECEELGGESWSLAWLVTNFPGEPNIVDRRQYINMVRSANWALNSKSLFRVAIFY